VGGALRRRWRRAERPLIVGAALAVLGTALVPPLAHVGRDLIQASDAFGLLLTGRLWWLLVRSLLLSGAVTATSLLIGVPLGVLFARADLPFRKLLFGAHLSIALLPPFLPALGWFHVFGRQGLLGSELTARALFSELGAILVLTSCFAPIVSALTALGVSGVEASLEEAGRVSLGPWRTAAFVLVPCAAPTISLAALVVFALTFSELGVPMFLSVPVYPTVIFARLGGMAFAPGEAAVFTLPLLLVALTLAALERRFAGLEALVAIGAARSSRRPLFSFHRSSLVAPVLAGVASLAPIAALLVTSIVANGTRDWARWIGSAPWNGMLSSTTAAIIMVGVATVLGTELGRRARIGLWSASLATLAFMMPSSILGVGLVAAWNREATSWVYGGFAILVIGFVARYSAVAMRSYAAILTRVPASLDEAARVAGASYRVRLGLMLRMTERGIGGTFILALLLALRDLDAAVLYYPPGGEPLTVRIFTLEANGPPGVVSALAVLHVTLTLAAAGVGGLVLRMVKA
jgi:iron(III) transport system permease protein